MTCEQVNVDFAGLVHDHLMASSKTRPSQTNNMLHHTTHSPSPLNGSYQHTILAGSENGFHSHHLQSLDGCLNSAPSAASKSQQAHELRKPQKRAEPDEAAEDDNTDGRADRTDAQSTITILRRHPMYDSLVLVKKYLPCLDGYILEFPISYADQAPATKACKQDTAANGKTAPQNDGLFGKAYDVGCGPTKLVSVYLDGDDPIHQHKLRQQNGVANGDADQQDREEVVCVPINGLLHRLNNYDRHGVAIDSRVYAFAMGLKTAERFLTLSTEKEVQEAPPL